MELQQDHTMYRLSAWSSIISECIPHVGWVTNRHTRPEYLHITIKIWYYHREIQHIRHSVRNIHVLNTTNVKINNWQNNFPMAEDNKEWQQHFLSLTSYKQANNIEVLIRSWWFLLHILWVLKAWRMHSVQKAGYSCLYTHNTHMIYTSTATSLKVDKNIAEMSF